MEGVTFACQAHLRILPDGRRAGFFLGDGAGVGKGRQISAIILDNVGRGRGHHMWVSTSSDLRLDAERDLRDVGCHVPVTDGVAALDKTAKKPFASVNAKNEPGVMFTTYSSLVSAGRKGRAKSSGRDKLSRLEQLIQWCGGDTFDGCLIFDECQ